MCPPSYKLDRLENELRRAGRIRHNFGNGNPVLRPLKSSRRVRTRSPTHSIERICHRMIAHKRVRVLKKSVSEPIFLERLCACVLGGYSGGTPPMMGQRLRTEPLFYYFRMEDQIPQDHLLRLIDRYVDFGFVRERLKNFYSPTGRPSIDPEVLLRLLLVGYLHGITSERRLIDEVRMHLAYRWFTRLGFEQEIPDHSTFSKNRHGRFRLSGVFQEVFEEIVRRCMAVGLVEGQHLAVDGTLVAADASAQSRVSREQLVEVAQLSRTVREYLTELEQQNPVVESDEPSPTGPVSTTDPDAAWAVKGGPAVLAYFDN